MKTCDHVELISFFFTVTHTTYLSLRNTPIHHHHHYNCLNLLLEPIPQLFPATHAHGHTPRPQLMSHVPNPPTKPDGIAEMQSPVQAAPPQHEHQLERTVLTSAYPTESLKSAPQPTPASIGVMTAQATSVLDAGGAGTGACGKIMELLKKRDPSKFACMSRKEFACAYPLSQKSGSDDWCQHNPTGMTAQFT